LRSATPFLQALPLAHRLAGAAIDDDLQLLVRAKRFPEGRDKVDAAQAFARDDTENRSRNRHENLRCSNVDADAAGPFGSGLCRAKAAEARVMSGGRTFREKPGHP
jgi:hypothetical protein